MRGSTAYGRGEHGPSGGDPLPASPEVVARFAPLLVALRWGTLTLAVALGVTERSARHVVLIGVVLALYTLWRTLWPIRYDEIRLGR